MGIGGKRVGAGRKSDWRSPTKMMRLPAAYQEQITEYAKLLDSEAQSETITLHDQVEAQVNQLLVTLKLSDRAAAKKLFKKLLIRLGALELAGNGKDETRIQTRLL